MAALVSPCVALSYLWDDYQFLGNALAFRLTDILPDKSDYFYRPISRGLYFVLLDSLGRYGALIGHILNAALLLIAIALLFRFVERLVNSRVAMCSSLAFASLGTSPTLVAWISGCQDLIAIVLVLAAFNLQAAGRIAAAIFAAALALLSKETTIALIPILACFDWITGKIRRPSSRALLSYTTLVILWVLVHPGVQKLLSRSLQSGATGYVGLEHPERWPVHLGKYLLTMVNVPLGSPSLLWRVNYLIALVLGASLLFVGILVVSDGETSNNIKMATSRRRVAILAALMTASPLLLTSVRKLPRQVDRLKAYSRVELALGRNVSGGTRPRLSWGRPVL